MTLTEMTTGSKRPSQREWLTHFITLARLTPVGVGLSERQIEEELARDFGVPSAIFQTSGWRQALERGVYVFLRWYGWASRTHHGTWHMHRIFYVIRDSLFSDDAEMADWIVANRRKYEALGHDEEENTGPTLLDGI